MKIKEKSSPALSLPQSDIVESKSYMGCSKPRELADPRMDSLKEEGIRAQGSSNNSAIGTQRGTDSSITSSMGEVIDASVMPAFYDERERNREAPSRNIALACDSSGDEAFTAETISPGGNNFHLNEVTSPLRWGSELDRIRHVKRRSSHMVVAASDSRDYDQQSSDQRRCNRFLSSETMRIVSNCHADENALAQYQPINYSRTGSRHASGEYGSNGSSVKKVGSNPFGNSYEPVPASGSSVMREIDLAVSLAHSRFKNVSPQRCDVLPNQGEISPAFSPGTLHVTRNDGRRSADAVIALRASQHADAPSMTKNYASHNINAPSAEDEWKRKSDYGSACPAVHELKATFEQSDNRELGHRSLESAEYSTLSGERNNSAAEIGPSESANNDQNGLAFETKITSNHDERNTASFAVGASLVHLQSPPHVAFWQRSRSRPTYDKQLAVRSSVKNSTRGTYTDVLSNSDAQNKPINLSLPQGKIRQTDLGCEISSQKLAKAVEFRKCAKSFSSREKPYQVTKRRTKSQCSVSPISSGPPPSYDRDSRPMSSRQGHPRDIGIGDRLLINDYNNDSASNQGIDPDSNSALFSPSEASHMMVQDEAKTYAILSGRRNEEMMNSHMLATSGSPIQQQSLFQQARHSHSIINYVGHHAQSPDIRPSEMSPSPPVRDHRATPSSSLPGIASSSKAFQNVIVPNRHNQHSASPSSRDDYQGVDAYQRQYDNSQYESVLQDTRHLHQHPSLTMAPHQSSSTFSPLHIQQSQHHHRQQPPQFLMKHQNHLPPHSGLGPSTAMIPYHGSLRIPQHQGYLKPPPVDLDDLSEDERERMRVKRERNRVAAAKCRNRRRELLERLEKEAEQLEREQELLRENVRRLRVQKLQLGNMLDEHETSCDKKVSPESGGTSPGGQEGSPGPQYGGVVNEEQSNNVHSAGIESGESSASQSATSPVQLSSQA